MMIRYRLLAACAMILLPSPPAPLHADTVIIIQNNYGQRLYGFQFVSSDPYDYQKLDAAPQKITMTFTQPVDTARSTIQVYDLYGVQVNDGTVTAEGNSMSTALPPLPQGRYRVKWKAQCGCAAQSTLNDSMRFIIR